MDSQDANAGNADYKYLRVTEPEPHICSVTLHRPERLNALNGETLKELRRAIRAIKRDERIRVWLLKGSPRPDGRPCFSAGVDLKAIGEGIPMHHYQGPQVTNAIDDMLKPSIAVLDGVASTGAIELALACDFRVVGEQVQVSDWHLKHLGSGMGAWGANTRWLDLVGAAKTKEVVLLGKVLDHSEAVQCGFATASAPSDALDAQALAMARTMAAMEPAGVRAALAHIQQSQAPTRDYSLRLAEQVSSWFGRRESFDERAQKFLQSKE